MMDYIGFMKSKYYNYFFYGLLISIVINLLEILLSNTDAINETTSGCFTFVSLIIFCISFIIFGYGALKYYKKGGLK